MNLNKAIKIIILAAAPLLAIGCKSGGGEKSAEQKARVREAMAAMSGSREVSVGKLHGQLPDGWTQVTPSSQMRKAQYSLKPVADDSEPGEVSAFYFGPDAGGVEPNIDRWYGQFDQPDGKQTSAVAKREEFQVHGMRVVTVEFTGTMKPSMMPGMPQRGAMPNWMNLSAIIVTPEGPWFFKGTGPVKTMSAHRQAMRQFLGSLSFNG